MKNRLKPIFILCSYLLLPLNCNQAFGQDIQLDDLDNRIEELMKFFNAPGLAISIVHNGEIQYSKGFGTRTIGKDEPVDNNTLFSIGSITKSFTPIALGMLLDEGKVSWDDKVVQYLPYFQLYDPYVTNSFTIRDLLVHRSGLKPISGGTLFYHSDLNRDEIIERLKFLDPSTDFRTRPAYQNVMYLVAAKIVEKISGMPWDDFIRERIFKPLGMNNTVISQSERTRSSNISTAHIFNEKFEVIPIEQEKLDNIAPAGSIYSSANDMARYINFILNNGSVGKDVLVSKHVFAETLKPQIHYSFFKPIHNEFTSYGFGWWLTPKNGNKIIEHSGGVDGASANTIMVHNQAFGVIVLTNTDAAVDWSLSLEVIGEFLNDPDFEEASANMKKGFANRSGERLERQEALAKSRVSDTKPSLALLQYEGIFTDEMYGDISITNKSNGLRIEFSHTPLFSGDLVHWNYDTFEIRRKDPRIQNGFITFEFDSKGTIKGFSIDQPNLLDVDFTELSIQKK